MRWGPSGTSPGRTWPSGSRRRPSRCPRPPLDARPPPNVASGVTDCELLLLISNCVVETAGTLCGHSSTSSSVKAFTLTSWRRSPSHQEQHSLETCSYALVLPGSPRTEAECWIRVPARSEMIAVARRTERSRLRALLHVAEVLLVVDHYTHRGTPWAIVHSS